MRLVSDSGGAQALLGPLRWNGSRGLASNQECVSRVAVRGTRALPHFDFSHHHRHMPKTSYLPLLSGYLTYYGLKCAYPNLSQVRHS
jgi:hypothetical protein